MEAHTLWKEVLCDLPQDIYDYLSIHFRVPFVLAKRESERIEPFWENRLHIGAYKIVDGHAWLNVDRIDYSALGKLFLESNLVLDKRIDDGRHMKYYTILGLLTDMPHLPISRRNIIEKGLELDSFECFLTVTRQTGFFIYSNMNSYLARLIRRLKNDPIYLKRIEKYLIVNGRMFAMIALLNNSEEALVYFLDRCDFRIYVAKIEFRLLLTGEMVKLYEKYQTELNQYFLFS